jgi:diguanylate cyclase (GGDEF)-like protein
VLDSAEVCKAAVVRAAHLFNAEFAELISYPEGSGGSKLYRFEAETQTLTFDPHLAGDDAEDCERSSMVEAPLTVATGEAGNVIGALRLRLAGSARLTERRQRVLRTFAHGVATSLQNARLYSEMRYRAEVSAYEAARDPLTGIANRKVLQAELEAALSTATADGTSVGLLLIDLDHFKEINDTLGHHAGDVVLCEVASRLNANVSPGDLVARLGGDEFAILLRHLPDQPHAELEGRRILSALCRPVHHTTYKLAVGGSIGVACYPDDGVNADDLLRRADMALYQAKQVRGAVSRYRSELDDHSVSKITLAGELRQALDSGQFLFLYQPQVSLSTGELTGAEALARWCHPTRGMLPPSDFIDLLERSGLMPDFAVYALDQTVRQATVWRSHGLDIPISVNLSARNLLDPSLADAVLDVLARYGMPADRLVVELTETTMVSDVEAMERVLKRLRGIGVQLSVDDFGTGYSSLAFLQRIAVNEIKIDQSFVRTIPHSDSDIAIVRATIDLAHGLGIRVVAEGVETEGHAVMLRDMGCDFAQGWHYGKPVQGAQLLRAWRTRRRAAVHVLDFAHAVTAATA